MVHVQVWPGAQSARVTDMTHAGQHGKRCRVWRVHGGQNARILDYLSTTETERQARIELPSWVLECRPICEMRLDASYDDLVATLTPLADPDTRYEEYTIRGIDAPVEKLTAGVPERWAASASETGIMLCDLSDRWNEWTEITAHGQTKPAAYRIARKVWPQVQAARTLHEASEILTKGGAKLHGYCAVD